MTKPAGDEPRAPVARDRRALQPYIKAQQELDREMLKVLSDASRRITADLKKLGISTKIGAQVRRDQLLEAKRAILQEQAATWRRLGDLVKARRYDAAAAGADSIHIYDKMLFKAVGRGPEADILLQGMREYAKSAIDLGRTRLAASRIDLSHNVYRARALSDGTVERLINQFLVRGSSAREVAQAVARYIDPNTAGGIRYAAMRLGRTELNNAFHASQAALIEREPWNLGTKWNLSSSHPLPDQCDEYAKHVDEAIDGRPGVWAKGDVPRKPHPQCLCFLTSVTETPSAFLRKLNAGRYDDFISEMS